MESDFEDFVRRVKEATALEDVIDQEGAEWRLHSKHGKYLRGVQHDSLVVNTEEQFYVWNERSEKGDVFNWLEKRHNWDFWTSLQWLAERAKIQIPTHFQRKDDQAARSAGRLREDVFGIAQRLFAKWLWEDEAALDYCRGRGWTDETIRESGIGFSGRNTAATVQEMRGEFAMHGVEAENPLAAAILGFRGDVKGWGEHAGVTIQENWIEWGMVPGMMGKTRLVYPHWVGGRVRYLSGRNILGAETNQEGRTVKAFNLPKALAGPRQIFYNHIYGRKAETCVIVEGQADAITMGQWGCAAVAMAGTAWGDHLEELGELRKRHARLYIGRDMDEAGLRMLMGEKNDWPLAGALGPMCRVIQWRVGSGE